MKTFHLFSQNWGCGEVMFLDFNEGGGFLLQIPLKQTAASSSESSPWLRLMSDQSTCRQILLPVAAFFLMETLTFSDCSEDQLDDLNVSELSVASHLASTGASRATGRDGPPWTFRTTRPSGTRWTLYSGANSTSSAAPLPSISWASSCFKGPFEHLKRFVNIF